jgi:hypothetical protein
MTINEPPHTQTGSTSRPGQMTSSMRAVAPSGAKVLRIGVVQAGRVIEERVIKQRSHVTVGPNEKNMFVVPGNKLPPVFRLFELSGGVYHLNFVDGLGGRVQLPSGVTELKDLKGQAQRLPQGVYQLRLGEDARGKVVIGDTTFLFQFVTPSPVQPKAQLPVAVMRGTGEMDWNTTIIAAFSFLLHFLALGAIYSDWMDPVVDDEVSVAGLIDTIKALPPPPQVEEQQKTDEKTEKAEEKEQPKAVTKSTPKPSAPGQKMSAQETAKLTNELAQLEMEVIGNLTSSGPATAGVLRSGEISLAALDEAAKGSEGVGIGGGDLKLGSGGGTIRPGSAGGGLASIGETGRGSGTEGTGTTAKVAGPKGNANVASPTVAGGTIANASRVVAGMRAAFRGCYMRGLQDNPDVQGSISLSIRVGPGGEVTGVTATPSGNLPSSVVACVQARASAAQFDPPEGGSAVVRAPVTFVRQ